LDKPLPFDEIVGLVIANGCFMLTLKTNRFLKPKLLY